MATRRLGLGAGSALLVGWALALSISAHGADSPIPVVLDLTPSAEIVWTQTFPTMTVTKAQLATASAATNPSARHWKVQSKAGFRVTTNAAVVFSTANVVDLVGPDTLVFASKPAIVTMDGKITNVPFTNDPVTQKWYGTLSAGHIFSGNVTVSKDTAWWDNLVKAGTYQGTVTITVQAVSP